MGELTDSFRSMLELKDKKIQQLELQVSELQKELEGSRELWRKQFGDPEEMESMKRLKHDLERQGREWQAAVNELCSCGGKGPDDPGVCVACKVYHRAKGNESQKR